MQRTVEEEGKERMEYARWTGGGKKPHQWGWENSANQLFAWSCRLRVLLRCTVHMYLHARYEDCQMITQCATFCDDFLEVYATSLYLRQRVTHRGCTHFGHCISTWMADFCQRTLMFLQIQVLLHRCRVHVLYGQRAECQIIARVCDFRFFLMSTITLDYTRHSLS